MPERELDRIFTSLASALDSLDFGEDDLDQALDDLVDAARGVFGVAGVGLMLVDERDRLRAIGASSEAAQVLERVQQQLETGPGVQSTETGEMVLVADLTVDPRWPQLSDGVREHGIRGVLSAPVIVREHVVGNLNLFDHDTRSWTNADVERARSLAGVAAIWLRIALDAHETGRLVSQLQQTLSVDGHPDLASEDA